MGFLDGSETFLAVKVCIMYIRIYLSSLIIPCMKCKRGIGVSNFKYGIRIDSQPTYYSS
jgi:hypothetical protein